MGDAGLGIITIFYTFIGGGARFVFAWDADIAGVDALAADIKASVAPR